MFIRDRNITIQSVEPLHLVTLACLIQSLTDKGYKVFIDNSNPELYHYILDELNFSEYWEGGKNHVETKSLDDIFNLWRIIKDEKDLYASRVSDYFKRTEFNNKDLSALTVSLVEAFYNVFDHAKAENNAFLLLRYEAEKKVLQIGISDFGIGISNSVRNYNKEIQSDIEAIKWAIQDFKTIRSTAHNKGLGMSNIIAAATITQILSGNGLLTVFENGIQETQINFNFPGTLICMEVDLTTFDEIEILDSFNW